jgi:hypothetical protein
VAASDPERCRENARNAVRTRHERTAPNRAADALTAWARDRSGALEPLFPHEVAVITSLAEHIGEVVRSAPRPAPEQFAELRSLLPAPAGRDGS